MATATAGGALTLLMALSVAGSHRYSGPTLLGIGRHGLHLTDLAVLAIGALGIVAVTVLSRRR